jgi:hypothetical protein
LGETLGGRRRGFMKPCEFDDTPVMRVRSGCVFAVVVAGLGVVGCTGDRSTFSEKADAICARAIATAVREQKDVSADDERREAFRRIVDARGSALDELHGLTPPSDRARRVERMLAHFDQSQRLLREATRVRGERSVGVAVAAAAEGNRGHAVARNLGLDDCARF